MSASENDNKVLIFGMPENFRLEIFRLLSRFSWTYICSNTISDFRKIDGEFNFKLAIFYISQDSYQTFSFVRYYMERNLQSLNCPTIAITKDKNKATLQIYEAIFKHVFQVENLEGEISQLIRYYYSQAKPQVSLSDINTTPMASIQAKGIWIDSLSTEVETSINFLRITNVKMKGALIQDFQLNNCRFAAYPDKSHKDNLTKIRIDGISKQSSHRLEEISKIIKNPKVSILSLEDDEELCFLLKRKFEKYPQFDYEYATNITTFFQMIEESKYDLYLIDYNLGEKNFKGLEVVKFLREKFGENVLIFMLSKANHGEKLPNYFEFGFNDYFFKPIDIKQVVAKLSYFLPPQINETSVALKKIPNESSELKLEMEIELISLNEHNCVIKTPFSIELGKEFLLKSFLEMETNINIRVFEQIDAGESFHIYKAQYLNPKMELITKIRNITSNDRITL